MTEIGATVANLAAGFHFLRPLWLLVLIPLGLLLVVRWRRRDDAAVWRGVVDAHLLPALLVGESGAPRRWPLLLLGWGWLLLTLALAGPAWEREPRPVFNIERRLVILLDLSPGMNAADAAPSRLARARFEILDLLRGVDEGQAALLAFGPEPFVVSPLTGDARTIAAQVPRLTTDLMPIQGPRRTDLALEQGERLLVQAAGPGGPGAPGGHLILVADGVGEPARANAAARRLAAAGHRVSVLAIGTPEGAPVPAGGGGFLTSAPDGGIWISRLESGLLRALAQAGDGRYVEAAVGDADTKALLAAGPEVGAALASQASALADRWREEGPWLLLALLPLAALAFRRGWLSP